MNIPADMKISNQPAKTQKMSVELIYSIDLHDQPVSQARGLATVSKFVPQISEEQEGDLILDCLQGLVILEILKD